MPSDIYSQIRNIIKDTQALNLGINFTDSKNYLPLEETLKLYDQLSNIESESHVKIQKSLDKIVEKISLLKQYRKDHDDEFQDVEKFENYIARSSLKLVEEVKKQTKAFLSEKISSYSPAWLMPIKTVDADAFKSPEYQILPRGKTTGTPIIKSKEWIRENLKENQAGIIIGVVNCGLRDWHNSTVSRETLLGAESDDLEVFDAIHEFERIYSNSLKMAMVRINKDSLKIEENNIAETVEGHLADKPNANSLKIYIISESYNFSKDRKSASSVIDLIPFPSLKQKGIENVELDIVSCNSSGIAAELIEKSRTIANANKMRISTCFHSGYIYNNITCAYIREDDYKTITDSESQKLPTLLSSTKKTKSSRLIEVVMPGFSSIEAKDSQKLAEYSCEKEIKIFYDERLLSTKKKIILKVVNDEDFGKSFKYVEDCRVAAKEPEQKILKSESLQDLSTEAKAAPDKPSQAVKSSYLEKMIAKSRGGNNEI